LNLGERRFHVWKTNRFSEEFRHGLVITFSAIENLTEFCGATFFGLGPGAGLPWRIVTDVLGVSAGKVGDPVVFFVLV
jgi:hypothetical protein